jgi:hypothetical protein
MKQPQRINWKTGMEITPEIFIESDEYHIAERQWLGTLLASRYYGIFPNSNFKIDYEFHHNQIVVSISDCTALVSSGEIINIKHKTSLSKELPVEEMSACYAVLSANQQIDESELHIVPQYDISFKRTNEPMPSGIPVLKLFKKTTDWEVDTNYIPPCIALNSVPSLMDKFDDIKNVINKIMHYYAENDSNYLVMMMLQLDFNHFSHRESPEALTIMMKKFCRIFQTHLKIVNETEILQSVKKFTDLLYNHCEIEKVLETGYASLMEILKILSAEPIPEIEEIKV